MEIRPEYILAFRGVKLGKVVQLHAEFPSLSGRFTADFSSMPRELSEHIQAYMAYSVEQGRLMEANDPTLDSFVSRNENLFSDLIDPPQWELIDAEGVSHPILIPIFYERNGMIWRWAL